MTCRAKHFPDSNHCRNRYAAPAILVAVCILLQFAGPAGAHDSLGESPLLGSGTGGSQAAGGPGGTPPGDCPPADLQVVLNTGWDQSIGGTLIPTGNDDDDWDVTVDASGGTVSRDATVINAHPAWLTLPNSKWVSASATGPNGTYVYEMCWCMDERSSNPQLSFEARADDEADFRLNGLPIGSTPAGSFNDAIPTIVTITDPTMFAPGVNCLEVEVRNTYGVVTGFNLAGTMTADDGLCCDCEADDLIDDASTGVDDASGTNIAVGAQDDEWVTIVDASGGPVPSPPVVITPNAAWGSVPGAQWIAANQNGQNGLYVYEKCWCMHEVYSNPQVAIDLLADDEADVYLNGNFLGTTGAPGFLNPPTSLGTTDATLFHEGQNCLTVEVRNTQGVVTGFSAAVTIRADNGQCCDCTDLPAGAEGWWKLDEATGPTAFEELNAYDGTHLEATATAPPPTPVPGKVNNALFFDGVDDYVEVPDAPGLNFTAADNLSVDAWIRTAQPFLQPIVWKKRFGPDPGYALYTSNGLLQFEMSDGATNVICTSNTFVDDGAWHFVAATVNRGLSNGIRLFIDGVIDQTCDPTTVPGSLSNSEPLYIGGYGGGGPAVAWFRGPIDEVELFRSVLSIGDVQAIYRAGNGGKCPVAPCEESDYPACDGECPAGQVCNQGGVAGMDACICEDVVVEDCGGTYPECNGVCPNPDEECRLDATGVDCHCDEIQLPSCTDTFYPECNGQCPDPTQICDQVPGTDFCDCFEAPTCENSMYPECNGTCPDPAQVCVEDPTGVAGCFCDDPPPVACEESDFPVCDGECPLNMECVEDAAQGCFCNPVETCEDTFYPECNGTCPAGEECRNILGSDNCDCQPIAQACGDALAPQCDGICPANSTCRSTGPVPGGGCDCVPCIISVPDGGVIIAFPNKDTLRWNEVECALHYNTYRLTAPRLGGDNDGDGLCDSGLCYGDCFQSEMIATESTDTSKPPPGSTHWYLVTGENFAGEGPLGNDSAGNERPNDAPCP